MVMERIVTVKSKSSGNYLDGRNPQHTGNQLFLTNRIPEGDEYLQWDLVPCGDTFAIQSVSRDNYLNVMKPSKDLGNNKCELTKSDDPKGDDSLQWKLLRFGETYAIQSMSSGVATSSGGTQTTLMGLKFS
jgi:hypothetical protein